MNLKQETQIVIQAGQQLMSAYNLAPPAKKTQIAGLMWECLRVAALLEDMPVDDLNQMLIDSLKADNA